MPHRAEDSSAGTVPLISISSSWSIGIVKLRDILKAGTGAHDHRNDSAPRTMLRDKPHRCRGTDPEHTSRSTRGMHQKQLGHASAEMTRGYQRRRDRFWVNLTRAAGL